MFIAYTSNFAPSSLKSVVTLWWPLRSECWRRQCPSRSSHDPNEHLFNKVSVWLLLHPFHPSSPSLSPFIFSPSLSATWLLNTENTTRRLSRGGFRHVQHVRPNRGPTKGAAHFYMPELTGDPEWTRVMRKKRSPVFQENWQLTLTHGRWWLFKKVASFFHEKKGLPPQVKGPHIFSEQGPGESKSAPAS